MKQSQSMSRVTLPAAALVLAGFAAAASAQVPSPPAPAAAAAGALGRAQTMLTTLQVMKHLTNPAAEAYWGLSGEIDTLQGTINRAPKDDAGWLIAANNAAIVAESGNLLLMTGRTRDARWNGYAEEMARVGAAMVKATLAHDVKALNDTGGELREICSGCHRAYVPRRDSGPPLR